MSGSEEKKINKLKLRKMLYTKLKVATPEFNANISLLALYFPPKKKYQSNSILHKKIDHSEQWESGKVY